MAKSARRNARQSPRPPQDTPQKATEAASGALARRNAPEAGQVLERLLSTPHLAQTVPRLQPEVLHRLIETCGLEDCGPVVALATPAQLQRVLDLDLWPGGRPGRAEQLDAGRFGVWLDVLMECGETMAAEKIQGLDIHLTIAALAQHVRVFDRGAASAYETTDGTLVTASNRAGDGPICEVGGFVIEPRRTDSWDAIVSLLLSLDSRDQDYLHRVMAGCRDLSNSRPEVDGLDNLLTDDEQDLFDLAFDRELRREQQGYATPEQASAFLRSSQRLTLTEHTPPAPNPVVRAYFEAMDWTSPIVAPPDDEAHPSADLAETAESMEGLAAVVGILRDAGVMAAETPRALLEGPKGSDTRLARLRSLMEFVLTGNPEAGSRRTGELGFLTNVMVAGCSIQARAFTVKEASEAVAATCNLGLEHWPPRWLEGGVMSDDFLVHRDLVTVFQVGWTILHRDVCMFAARRLIATLSRMKSGDSETQSGLNALRRDLKRYCDAGTPWLARDALDVIASLDLPAWAALLGLIDECPVLHACITSMGSGALSVSASDFEFISENGQIASIHKFMTALPDMLA